MEKVSVRLKVTENYTEVRDKVNDIIRSKRDYVLKKGDLEKSIPHYNDFSSYGISAMAGRLNFPAGAFHTLALRGSEDIADEIIRRFTIQYLNTTPLRRSSEDKDGRAIFVREFYGKIYGYLSERYSCFDDNEVLKVIENSNILDNTESIWYSAEPERLHVRFIDREKFIVGNDASPLSMAVFVDNSMVGASCFKIRFGVYRHACTNGCIWSFKEFVILKEQHKGEKDWQRIVAEAMSGTKELKDLLKQRIIMMQDTNSAIYGLSEDKAIAYIKSRLITGEKVAAKILDFYANVYDGHSKWALSNAITDAAHELSLEERLNFEQRALMVA